MTGPTVPPRTGASPFSGGTSRLPTWLKVAAFTVLLAAGGLAAYLVTRGVSPAETDAAHLHGAAAANADDKDKTVSLTQAAAQRIGVTYAVAAVGPLRRQVRTAAIVAYDETRVKSVSPKLDGWIERLYVDFTGMPVRIGDPLLTIYSPMVVSAQQELLLARRLSQQLSQATPDATTGAQSLLESARRRLLYWDIPESDIDQLERTGEVQKTVTLRSPATGVVVEKNVLGGQRVMAGDALYQVVDLSVVWLEGEVFERDFPAIRLGGVVEADFQAIPGKAFHGRITYVYPTLNPETRTGRIRVELRNPRLELKPGMYATILFDAPAASVLSVPRSAVLSTGKRTLVFMKMGEGRFMPMDVVLGATSDDRIEILAGLAPGDTVVASATFLVDAESNLGSALGGMGNMPGMDMRPPGQKETARPNASSASKDTGGTKHEQH